MFGRGVITVSTIHGINLAIIFAESSLFGRVKKNYYGLVYSMYVADSNYHKPSY